MVVSTRATSGSGKKNSEAYNYYEWKTKNRASAAQHVKSDTEENPSRSRPSSRRPCAIPPLGHHPVFRRATAEPWPTHRCRALQHRFPNRHLDDVFRAAARPNVDSRCTGTTMRTICAPGSCPLPGSDPALRDHGCAGQRALLWRAPGKRLTSAVILMRRRHA